MAPDLQKVRKRMITPTSGKDLKYMLGDAVKVVQYSELQNYKTLDELLDPYKQVIILYPIPGNNPDGTADIGHWCCVFIQTGTNNIIYFDSYGCYIDHNIDRVNSEREEDGKSMIDKHLLDLMIDSPYDDFHYNDCPFQNKMNRLSSVCGLWVVLRLKNNTLSCEQFEKLFFDAPIQAKIEPDLFCSYLICDMYPEMS